MAQLHSIICARCGKTAGLTTKQFNRGRKFCSQACSRAHFTTHGMSDTPEHQTWIEMRARCRSRHHGTYQIYGGRGIRVCERWDTSFEHFLADMGPKPSPDHSIDRVDVNGGYCPENCRWATRSEQARNTTVAVALTFNGETRPLAEWAERLGMAYRTLYQRVHFYGWSTEDALTRPLRRWPSQR